MSNFPRYSLSGGNQYPVVSTTIPSQYPVIEIVDGQGNTVTNLGNGAADGTWTNMTLINGFTAGTITPQYMKDSRGWVFLRGRVVCPGGQQVCWNIPVGYRPAIDAASENFFDWLGGGTDLVNPGRTAGVITTVLLVGQTSAGTAGLAGAIAALDRIAWSTV